MFHDKYRRKWAFVFTITLGAILTACNFPQPVRDDPSCDPMTMQPPELTAPFEAEVLDILQPNLSWENPNACQLESFHIHVSNAPDMRAVTFGEVGSHLRTWKPALPLEAGRQYWWRVYPNIDSVTDEAGGVDYVLGPPSEIHTFYTGPECSTGELPAPVLLEPVNEAHVAPRNTISMQVPEFVWDNPGRCLSDTYQILLSEQPDAAPPLTLDHMVQGPATRWQLDVDLEEDTRYYWKVRTIVSDGVSPFSQVGTFMTTAIDAEQPGVVSGVVWHDACENPVPRDQQSDPLPDGCEIHSGLIMANGQRDVGESGIAGVEVMIGDGPCPIVETPTIVETDELGVYYQFLPMGEYCVEIAVNSSVNETLLLPGIWSYPSPGGLAQAEVTLMPGEANEDVDFGWDYDYERPVGLGSIGGRVWSDLDQNGYLDGGEPGIEGLELWLFQGACDDNLPTGDDRVINAMRTDGQGLYGYGSNGQAADVAMWQELEAGDYCVMVDTSDDETLRILHAGVWTSPAFGYGLPTIPLSIQPGEQRSDINFGWHYPPYLVTGGNANCRGGPGVVYPSTFVLEDESKYLILGHNPATTWLGIEPQFAVSCWVSDAIVSVYGDPTESTVWPIPPTPIPPDTSPPNISVNHSPAFADITDSILFTANASDDRGVTRIMIYIKPPGAGSYTIEKECVNSTACTYGGGPYSKGLGEYYAEAWDEAGNVSSSDVIIFEVEDPFL